MQFLKRISVTAITFLLLTLTPMPTPATVCPPPGAFLQARMQGQWGRRPTKLRWRTRWTAQRYGLHNRMDAGWRNSENP
jgi:hypothetical protein